MVKNPEINNLDRSYKQILLFQMFVCCLFSTNIDLYLGVRLYDIGAILAAILPFLACLMLRGTLQDYMISSLCLIFIFSIALMYGDVFSTHYPSNPLISALSQRGWLYFMLAPSIYILCKKNVEISDILTVLIAAIYASLVATLYLYYTADLSSMKSSADPDVRALVRVDSQRGFRLVIQHFAASFALIFGLGALISGRSKKLHSVFLIVTTIVLFLSYSRIVLLILPISVAIIILTPIRNTLFRKGIYLCLFVFLISSPFILNYGLGEYAYSDISASVRIISLQKAHDIIQRFPLLGYGPTASSIISYELIFGEGFFPSDLGSTGVLFVFGYVGFIIFTGVAIISVSGALRAYVNASRQRRDYATIALPVVMMLMGLCSFSFPAFLMMREGILLSSFGMGFAFLPRSGG